MRCRKFGYLRVLAAVALTASLTLSPLAATRVVAAETAPAGDNKEGSSKVYEYTMKSLSGEKVELKKYEGKVVLAVNVASKCGYTNQYRELQQLHEKYKDQGLAVLGFPCNQFGKQEPGDSKAIREFCDTNYGVTFDLFDKVDVNKDSACDLYKYLTSVDAKPVGKGPIKWNFEKILIDRNGQVVARFGSSAKPDSEEVVAEIEKLLAEK